MASSQSMRNQFVQVAVSAVLVSLAYAHPSGFAGGRASCGIEYSSVNAPFDVKYINESFYFRRIQTCESPFFWTTFEATEDKQEIYIATIMPEMERFRDKLRFRAALFGPGIPPTKEPLPEGLEPPIGYDYAIYKSPDDLSSCAFVDKNPVMRMFSDVIDGRCAEELKLDDDYDSNLIKGKTWTSWWLQSNEEFLPKKGRYYMATWLVDSVSGLPTTGKYEMTIAPHIWYYKASEDIQKQVQAQGTTCTCAANFVTFREEHLERVADIPAALFEEEVPYAVCDGGQQDVLSTRCYTGGIRKDPKKALEWGGEFDLVPGVYQWTLRAEGKDPEYHEPAMDIVFMKAGSVDQAFDVAEALLLSDDSIPALPDVMPNSETKQTITMDQSSSKTVVNFNINETGRYILFTQHQPWEFSAVFMSQNSETSFYFPVASTDYVDEDAAQPFEDTSTGKIGGIEALSTELTRLMKVVNELTNLETGTVTQLQNQIASLSTNDDHDHNTENIALAALALGVISILGMLITCLGLLKGNSKTKPSSSYEQQMDELPPDSTA